MAKKKVSKQKPAKKPIAKAATTAGAKAAPAKVRAKKAPVAKPTSVPSAGTANPSTHPVAPPQAVVAPVPPVAPAPTTAAPTVPSTPVSPSYKGAPTKLAKDTFPDKSPADDFQCFGPPAMRDGEFEQAKICDMGCFTQDGKDTNKYYHGAVVQHKKTRNWYAYYEWGRTGAQHPSFQFVACASEADASREFARQLHSKNDRRGEWSTVAGIRTLRARKGQDCYLVRPIATRSTGLPDARGIKSNEGAKQPPRKAASAGQAAPLRGDKQTLDLLRDLNTATIAYTRGSMADNSLPTQLTIDEARAILGEAQKRLLEIGDEVKRQFKDRKLLELTTLMYGRIPKLKPLGADRSTWILSQDNILNWQNDLDAFESALYAEDIDIGEKGSPLDDLKLDMEWIPPDSELGDFFHGWWPKATNNRHDYIGKMRLHNLWRLERHADRGKLDSVHREFAKSKGSDRPMFQPDQRPDLSDAERNTFNASNTALLFHGTRSVNVSGILRESLRMPKTLVGVVITGAMFGPGIYFADDWKKSAGYTSLENSYWSRGSGAVRGRHAFMFAADVVLGKPFVSDTWKAFTKPPDGHHSVYGKAGKAGLQNNEFIVYRGDQCKLRYLAEFSAT
ncbi:MAG TPA: WGR domain-containing protein [Planctomycetota bacterium]